MRASTVRAVRKALNLTQGELARALMVRECTVYRWEADKRRVLPMDVVRRIVLEKLAGEKCADTLAFYHDCAHDPYQPCLIAEVLRSGKGHA